MTKLFRDGIGLNYTDEGAGPPVVVIHGWACDARSMAPLARHLARSRRVISVDLRGHGESDKPEQTYTVEGFADDVAWMADALGVKGAAVIGHSLGGSIALALGARRPEVFTSVVVLEALIVAYEAAVAGFAPVRAGVEGPQCEVVARAFAEQLHGPWFEPAAKAASVDRMLTTPAHVLRSAIGASFVFDSVAAAAACKVPLLYVGTGTWYTDLARLRELCPQLVSAQLVGCGHYFCEEVPDQTGAVVGRFLEVFAGHG